MCIDFSPHLTIPTLHRNGCLALAGLVARPTYHSSVARQVKMPSWIHLVSRTAYDTLASIPFQVRMQTLGNGEDLRFFDSDGTFLNYETEEWNEGGTSHVVVRVPQIDAPSNSDSKKV